MLLAFQPWLNRGSTGSPPTRIYCGWTTIAGPKSLRAKPNCYPALAIAAPFKAATFVGRFVGGPFDDDDGFGGPGGWWIFVEVDVQLTAHDVVRPDLAGWRRERLPKPGPVRPIEVAPDWVSEVISPSTASLDRVTKRALYARHGVNHYWIVDPDTRSLEALELSGDRWLELGAWTDDAKVRVAPFGEVELELARLFLPREADVSEPPQG